MNLRFALARWGRHDRDCPAFGSFNCDERCICGLRDFTLKLDEPETVPVVVASITQPDEWKD